MIHLRIVARNGKTEPALALLERSRSVCNVVLLPAVARDPGGDLILADVAREDASIVVSDLEELGLGRDGSISLTEIDTLISELLAFMVIATLLAAVGIYQDSAILIVGAMVVGPEFGPLAGFCVAAVERRRELALRSARALAVGFPLTITAAFLATLAFRATGLFEDSFSQEGHSIANIIAQPDFFTFFVAACWPC